jgi:hypothetical protein
MSSADVLRQLAAAGVAQAATDGAAALDQAVKDAATIAGLQTSLDAATKQLAAVRPELYTVKAGDTLSAIAKTEAIVGGDWHSIVAWNNLPSTAIKAGQQLLLISTAAAPVPAPPPSPEPPPAPAPAGVLFGINPGDNKTMQAAVTDRMGKLGAVPAMKLFSLADVASVPGKRAQCCRPFNQVDLAAGKNDAEIVAHMHAQLDAGAELVLYTNWQEPDGEIKSSSPFTLQQYLAGTLHLSKLIQANGEQGRTMLAQCLIAPQKRTGMPPHPEWVLTPDQVGGLEWARLTLDNYANPSGASQFGGDVYATPYPAVDDVIVDMIAYVHDTGYDDNWAVSEWNSPWRKNWMVGGKPGDPDQDLRLALLDGYVKKLTGLPKPPKHMFLWEGTGSRYDQTFKVQKLWDWYKGLVARSA